MKIEKDSVIFGTGKVLEANNGIIGLAQNDRTIYEGYDGTLEYFEDNLTPQEVDELCEYMINLWEEYLDKYGSGQKTKRLVINRTLTKLKRLCDESNKKHNNL